MPQFILLFIVSFITLSCSSQYPVLSRVIPVAVPVSSDSLMVTYKTDTVIVATHTHLRDTVAKIEYFPQLAKFFYKIKHDTIFIPTYDTIYLAKFLQPESNNALYYLIFGGSLILLLFLWRLFPK